MKKSYNKPSIILQMLEHKDIIATSATSTIQEVTGDADISSIEGSFNDEY